MPSKVWYEITNQFPNSNGCTVEVWEWISNSIPHFIMAVITYRCWDQNWSMLVKGASPGGWVWAHLQQYAHNLYFVWCGLSPMNFTHTPQGLYSLSGRTSHDDVIKWKHFRVIGPFCGEFTGHRWISRTKASDAELWCFLWSAPE